MTVSGSLVLQYLFWQLVIIVSEVDCDINLQESVSRSPKFVMDIVICWVHQMKKTVRAGPALKPGGNVMTTNNALMVHCFVMVKLTAMTNQMETGLGVEVHQGASPEKMCVKEITIVLMDQTRLLRLAAVETAVLAFGNVQTELCVSETKIFVMVMLIAMTGLMSGLRHVGTALKKSGHVLTNHCAFLIQRYVMSKKIVQTSQMNPITLAWGGTALMVHGNV